MHYNFSGLSDQEVGQYVLHKIACAGGAASTIDHAALSAVHSHSQGSPRLVGNLMTNALTLGAQMEKKVIDTEDPSHQGSWRTRPFRQAWYHLS